MRILSKIEILLLTMMAFICLTACGKKGAFKGNIAAEDTYYDMTFYWLNTVYIYDMEPSSFAVNIKKTGNYDSSAIYS